jgi:hypothetical protein
MAGIVDDQETVGAIVLLNMVRDRGIEIVLRFLCS